MERTHEKVVGFWTWTANVEKLEQIPKLPMDVTAYLTRGQFRHVDTATGGLP